MERCSRYQEEQLDPHNLRQKEGHACRLAKSGFILAECTGLSLNMSNSNNPEPGRPHGRAPRTTGTLLSICNWLGKDTGKTKRAILVATMLTIQGGNSFVK